MPSHSDGTCVKTLLEQNWCGSVWKFRRKIENSSLGSHVLHIVSNSVISCQVSGASSSKVPKTFLGLKRYQSVPKASPQIEAKLGLHLYSIHI